MKTSFLKRGFVSLLLLMLAVFWLPGSAAAATVALVAPFLNFNACPILLGSSYTRINATTYANNITDTANAAEQLWVKRILMGHRGLYQDAPLSEGGFMGRVMGGEKPDATKLRKAVLEIMETRKVLGNTIHIPTMTGLGGPIVVGEGDRIGSEQKIHEGTYDITIGLGWYGAGWTSKSRDETVLGSMYDSELNNQFRMQLAQKKNNDHLMRMRQSGTANLMYPDGINSLATIKTANVMDTVLITNLGEELPSRGGIPMDTTDDSGGSNGECFTLLSTHRALTPLYVEPAYLQAQTNAGLRGPENKVFKGGFSYWNGHGIYRWISRDHANKGPLGSALEPRARLGVAITSGTTNTVVTGGGLVYSASETPLPQYFENFLNAFYQYFNGQTVARVTNVTRHIMIINNDGTGYGVYPYTTVGTGASDASQITISGAALNIVGASGGPNTQVTDHPVGSLIVQCNVLGVPVGWSEFLGAQAVVAGYGRIDGTDQDPVMGRRTEEVRNHQSEYAIGAEMRWGNALVTRAGDSAFPNFLVANHAIPLPGAPIIV